MPDNKDREVGRPDAGLQLEVPSLGEIVNAATQAVIVTTLDGVITHWSASAEALYGWRRSEVLGLNIVDVISAPAVVEAAEEIMQQLRRGRSWAGQFSVRHRLGHEFEVFVIDAPLIRNGAPVAIIGMSIPVSDQTRTDEPFEVLTRREAEVARMTARGKTSGEIAGQLGISARTVESHRASVYRKLGVRTRTELILRVVRSAQIAIDSDDGASGSSPLDM